MYLLQSRQDDALAVGLSSKSGPVKVPTTSPWKDPRTSLFYLAAVSIALLAFPLLASWSVRLYRNLSASLAAYRARRRPATDETSPLLSSNDAAAAEAEDEEVILVAPPRAESRVLPAGSGSLTGDLKQHVQSLGGWLVFFLHLFRLLACVALVGLTLWAIVIDAEDSAAPPSPGGSKRDVVEVLKKGRKHGHKGRKGERRREAFGREEWVEIGQCFFFIYCSALSLAPLILPRLRLLQTHLSLLLLAAFLLSAYRNLFPPLVGKPALDIVLHHLKGVHDPLWDTLVWLRVGLLTLAGVGLPVTLVAISPESRHLLLHSPLSPIYPRSSPTPTPVSADLE